MSKQPLVLDGNEVKLRLQAERKKSSNLVHVDWVSFTTQLTHAPVPTVDVLFPSELTNSLENPRSIAEMDLEQYRRVKILRILRDMPDEDFAASAQAHSLALKVCNALGPDFRLEPELKKGLLFYKLRWSITRNDAEVAWVGFLAASDSPRLVAQASSIHVNVTGSACTFAHPDWRFRMSKLIKEVQAKITRVDLALDFFDGIQGGLSRIRDDWHDGLMDVRGRRPKPNTVGPWVEGGRGRSFYFGSREAGKQTNVYEKGVQLFGADDATHWERIELRYGDKFRVLPADVLTRPDDFFAGASDWHQQMLAEHGKYSLGERISVRAKQAVETVKAEVTRSVRWLTNTAAPSIALAFEFLGEEEFLQLVLGKKRPGRLQKFNDSEISAACSSLNQKVFQPKVRSVGLAI